MKRISFFKGNRSDNLLHIETEGCIVNIRVGLQEHGTYRDVTSIEILPDNGIRGEEWDIDGSINNRVIKKN